VIEELEKLNIENESFNLGIKEMKEVVKYLNLMNVKHYYIDLTIARGLDYYTGTIYETFLTDYPEIGSISSGGRYENLAGYYTNKKLPGVGMSIGLTRLFYKLNELGLINENKSNIADYLIVPMEDDYNYIFKVYNKLKDEGKKVEICLLNKNFKSKMKYANRTKIPFVIIIGENEIKNNTIVIKNMEEGTQVTENIF
jgi:histidyl-tRNA synthetase